MTACKKHNVSWGCPECEKEKEAQAAKQQRSDAWWEIKYGVLSMFLALIVVGLIILVVR